MAKIPRILVLSILWALATRLPAEPPTGSYLLAVAANSRADGIRGPQVGILAGGRARVSDSVALLVELSVLHSPKLDAGDGYLLGAILDVEHWWRAWYAALGVSWAVQETSVYLKEARALRLTIGRQMASLRLSATWRLPDATPNHAESLGFVFEGRHGRGILRVGLAWLRHRDGEGIRLSWAAGLAW